MRRRTALSRFLDDSRIEIDNNTVERAIRPSHSAERTICSRIGWRRRVLGHLASLLATAKLNNIELFGYLKGILERLSEGHRMSQIDELLPWKWTTNAAAQNRYQECRLTVDLTAGEEFTHTYFGSGGCDLFSPSVRRTPSD